MLAEEGVRGVRWDGLIPPRASHSIQMGGEEDVLAVGKWCNVLRCDPESQESQKLKVR